MGRRQLEGDGSEAVKDAGQPLRTPEPLLQYLQVRHVEHRPVLHQAGFVGKRMTQFGNPHGQKPTQPLWLGKHEAQLPPGTFHSGKRSLSQN